MGSSIIKHDIWSYNGNGRIVRDDTVVQLWNGYEIDMFIEGTGEKLHKYQHENHQSPDKSSGVWIQDSVPW